MEAPATLRLEVAIDSDEDRRALRGALLAARASELSEVQRRAQRHGLGYGTESQRESMTAEVDHARRRWEMLDRLLAALGASDTTEGPDREGPTPRG